MKDKEKDKMKWYGLLFLAVALFLVAMVTNQIMLNAIVVALAIYIYKEGNPVLFKEYHDKQQKKIAESAIIREAAKEALNSGKVLKKR